MRPRFFPLRASFRWPSCHLVLEAVPFSPEAPLVPRGIDDCAQCGRWKKWVDPTARNAMAAAAAAAPRDPAAGMRDARSLRPRSRHRVQTGADDGQIQRGGLDLRGFRAEDGDATGEKFAFGGVEVVPQRGGWGIGGVGSGFHGAGAWRWPRSFASARRSRRRRFWNG